MKSEIFISQMLKISLFMKIISEIFAQLKINAYLCIRNIKRKSNNKKLATMKKNINKETGFVILSILFIFTFSIYMNHLHSKIDYLNTNCPVCSSQEVGDFGEDHLNTNLGTKAHCFDCGTDFYVKK